MKKIFLLLLSISYFSSHSQTSLYHPFPDSDAVWTESFGHGLILCGEDWSYRILGDTTIGSFSYHKLIIPYVHQTGACTPFHSTGYNGCFRQDTLIKKVYYIAPGSSTEILLYDFNLQIGDTVYGVNLFGCTATIDTINAIDSVLIGSNYRKRWTIGTSFNANHIIEGIGYESGLLESCGRSHPDISYFSLECFQQDGITLYPDSNTVCNLIESTGSAIDPILVTISPNPFHSRAILIAGDEFRNAELDFFDLTGKEIKKQILMGDQVSINRELMDNGIYFYALKNKVGKVFFGKVVIQ